MLCEGDSIITDPKQVGEIFNEYFITVVDQIGITEDIEGLSIHDICEKYSDHPSVCSIANKHHGKSFAFTHISVTEMTKMLKHVNPKKATGFDQFPPKLLHAAGSVLAPSLTSLVNYTITCCQFPEDLKCAELSPVFKKDDVLDKTKYRPLSILPCISKILERVIDGQMSLYFSEIMEELMSAYRKMHNTQSILLKAVEDWKSALDQGKYVGAIMMDLSKAFDVVPHGLLLAKLGAYGCSENVLKLMFTYLSGRKQRTKIGCTRSEWKVLMKGVPQGSVLGPTLFNIFMNDIYLEVKSCEIYNYADDNTASVAKETPEELTMALESDGNMMTQWFTTNGMKANPDKYQSIVFGSKPNAPTSFKIMGNDIQCEHEVKLLGVYIDSKLTFNRQIVEICQKAGQ